MESFSHFDDRVEVSADPHEPSDGGQHGAGTEVQAPVLLFLLCNKQNFSFKNLKVLTF